MKRTIAKLLCVTVCVAMTTWLVRYEAFPGYFAATSAGYRNLFDLGTLLVDQWTKITYEGQPIGYSHTELASHREGDDPEGEMSRLQNRTVLEMKILGMPQRVTTTTVVALDEAQRLQRFTFVLAAEKYTARISAKRARGTAFEVEVHTGAATQTIEIEIPDDVVIYSPLTEMALRNLKPGKTFRIKTLDPITFRVANLVCRAIDYETLTLNGEDIRTTRMEVNYQGMVVQSWMDAQGRVVRQETPLGWVMEKSSREEVRDLTFDSEGMADMILASAVPLVGGLTRHETCRELQIRLHGMYLDPAGLSSYRQEVTAVSNGVAEVTLSRRPWPAEGLPLSAAGEGREADLAATPYVQADHPEIIEAAQEIVGDTDDSLEAARRLFEWVRDNVEKSATVSLPSALDVLHQRVGDCNEHTYLFVGLARAAGLPARIKIGLVYHPVHGSLYYHAWPAVYVGEWVETDPTLGQREVDVTHLALLEGELRNQLELMKVMGRLRVEVVDAQYEADR